VGCRSSADCSAPTSPICDATTNTCVPCTTDAQCVAKLGSPDPGVCMFQQDGHCATSNETVYVNPTANGCLSSATTGGGTATTPFCQLAQAIVSAGTRQLFILRGGSIAGGAALTNGSPLSFVGQMSATITAGAGQPALHVTGVDLYMRDVEIRGGAGTDIGIVVDGAGTIRLDGVTIDDMANGGLLIDSSNFDIENTTISSNGPGQEGNYFLGGILITNPPSSGLAKLHLVTITNNNAPGVQCSAPVQGDGVLATGNSTAQISTICGFSSCTTASATCGAP
jgi:hypothetical protein